MKNVCVAFLIVTGLIFSNSSFAQNEYDRFLCHDRYLKEVMISIEKNQSTYSLFKYDNDQQKILVDQGLTCEFSKDGKQLFLCSKKLMSTVDLVQYYSESQAVDSMMEGSIQSTGIYKISWESDIRKSSELVTSIFGLSQNQCVGK